MASSLGLRNFVVGLLDLVNPILVILNKQTKVVIAKKKSLASVTNVEWLIVA